MTIYHSPVGLAFTDVQDKATDDLAAFRRMGDFRMELNAIEMFDCMRDSSVRCCICSANDMKIVWRLLQLVAM